MGNISVYKPAIKSSNIWYNWKNKDRLNVLLKHELKGCFEYFAMPINVYGYADPDHINQHNLMFYIKARDLLRYYVPLKVRVALEDILADDKDSKIVLWRAFTYWINSPPNYSVSAKVVEEYINNLLNVCKPRILSEIAKLCCSIKKQNTTSMMT